MLKCGKCGSSFGEPREKTVFEDFGLAVPIRMDYTYCPVCGSDDIGVARRCKSCEGYFFKEEMFCDICDDCVEKHGKTVDMCYRVGRYYEEEIKLNCFLTNMFTPTEIEFILMEVLKTAEKEGEDLHLEKFIECDKDWFAENLAKEVIK